MRVIDPQSAALTNIEVLAYLTANPPRRPPNPPPNSRHWVPSPDLRDHNTVVKEIHNYVSRLSPHILTYPQYVPDELKNQPPAAQQPQSQSQSQIDTNGGDSAPTMPLAPVQANAPTPMDNALRELVVRLQPFGLTKGEVLMIVNLGVGVGGSAGEEGEGDVEGEGEGEGEEQMHDGEGVENGEMNGDGADADGMEVDGEGEGAAAAAAVEGEEGEGDGELAEEDYGALALLDTVIEEREERLSNEDVTSILRIIRELLGPEAKGV